VLRVRKEFKVFKDLRATKAFKDLRVSRANRASRVFKARWVLKGHKACRAT
jgi:hypothetical protein